jgi:porin
MLRIPLTCLAACMAVGVPAAQAAEAFSADSAWMTGDWGGLRREWLARGIDIKLGYTGETSTLMRGGYHSGDRSTRYADQFNAGVDLDLQRLFGWQDAAFSLSLSNRNGAHNLNEKISDPRATGMGSTQEIQGRGSVIRLSELWLSKGWYDDALNIKAGRFAVSDDFAVEDCLFQNLAFCGSQPGNYVDTIYNGPISQWATRVRYRLGSELYAQIGAFNINPSDLSNDNGFRLNGSGTQGTLVPVELVWFTKVNRLPGEYRVGYYHSNANGTDVYKDEDNQPAAITGNAYRSDSSRHGLWVVGKQQLTSVAGDAARGLTVAASATFQDRATTPVDSYQKVSLSYKGLFDTRPIDTLSLGVARVHASSPFLRNARTTNARTGASDVEAGYLPEQHSMYVAELNYGVQATRWLNIMPSLQYVKDPDGVREVQSAWVMGMQVQSQF